MANGNVSVTVTNTWNKRFVMLKSAPMHDVILAIAERKGVKPTELEPLNEWVEPEALDTLLRSPHVEVVRFQYEGYSVSIDHDNGITIT